MIALLLVALATSPTSLVDMLGRNIAVTPSLQNSSQGVLNVRPVPEVWVERADVGSMTVQSPPLRSLVECLQHLAQDPNLGSPATRRVVCERVQ